MAKRICGQLLAASLAAALFAAGPGVSAQESEKRAPEKNQSESMAEKTAPDWMQPAQHPIELRPSAKPITLHLEGDSRGAYETIGKAAGIKVLFDPDYVPRPIRVDINNLPLTEALKIAAVESGTFWRPVAADAIFVAQDTTVKRREFEQSIYKTFYLSNVSQPNDMQDVVNALRTIGELQRVQQVPSLGAIVVRGTPAQMVLTQKIIDDIDKARKKFAGEYRLDFRINELEGEKRLNSRAYTLLIEPHEFGKLRIGTRVPIQTSEGKQLTYIDVGQNIDCQVRTETERMVGLNVDVDFSNFGMTEQLRDAGGAATGNPVLQQFRITTKTDLEIGKPTIINSFDDPSSKRTFQIEVTVTRVREKE